MPLAAEPAAACAPLAEVAAGAFADGDAARTALEQPERSTDWSVCKRRRRTSSYRATSFQRTLALERASAASAAAAARVRGRERRTPVAGAAADGAPLAPPEGAFDTALDDASVREAAQRLVARKLQAARRVQKSGLDAYEGQLLTSPRLARLCGAISVHAGWVAAGAPSAVLLRAVELDVAGAGGWQQDMLTIHGQRWPEPRLKAFFGAESYSYHGVTMAARAMPPVIAALTEAVNAVIGTQHNSVMCTLYRTGSDAISPHADDEACLGDTALSSVSSLSLGDSRLFSLSCTALGQQAVPDVRAILAGGDLLHMGRGVQAHWKHKLEKTSARCGRRVSLTWRRILSSQELLEQQKQRLQAAPAADRGQGAGVPLRHLVPLLSAGARSLAKGGEAAANTHAAVHVANDPMLGEQRALGELLATRHFDVAPPGTPARADCRPRPLTLTKSAGSGSRRRHNVYPRVPRCGQCKHCLHPAMKQACITNRFKLRESIQAAGLDIAAMPACVDPSQYAHRLAEAFNATDFELQDPAERPTPYEVSAVKLAQSLAAKAEEHPDKALLSSNLDGMRVRCGEDSGPASNQAPPPERRANFYDRPFAFYGHPGGVKVGDTVALADAWGLGIHRAMRRGMCARRWGEPSEPWPCESVRLCGGQKDALNCQAGEEVVHYVGDGFYTRRPKGLEDDALLTFSDASLLASEFHKVPVRFVHQPGGGTGGCIYRGLYFVASHYSVADGSSAEVSFRLCFVLQRVCEEQEAAVAALCQALNAPLRREQEKARATGRPARIGGRVAHLLGAVAPPQIPGPSRTLRRDIEVRQVMEQIVSRVLLAISDKGAAAS